MGQYRNVCQLNLTAVRRLVIPMLVAAPLISAANGEWTYFHSPSRGGTLQRCAEYRQHCAAIQAHNVVFPASRPHGFLPASCAPQVADTPIPSGTSTPASASPTPTSTPAGTPTLDQLQLACTGGLSVRRDPTQTFTVGLDGLLVRVDIVLCSPTKNVRINLTASTTGASVKHSTASVTLPYDYSDCAWYEFDYNKPLTVSTGDVLRLAATAQGHKTALWGYDGQGEDVYPRGTGNWSGETIDDFAFQTYVQ